MEKEKLDLLSEYFNERIQVPQITRNLKYITAKVDVTPLGFLTLSHPYNKKLIKKYQMFKCFSYNEINKAWEIKKIPNIEVCRFLLNLNQENPKFYWKLSKKAFQFLEREYQKFKIDIEEHLEKVKLKRNKDFNDLGDLNLKEGIEPFPFQKVGVKFLELNNGVAMIGDSMGLGKTMQAIAYTSKNNLRTAVVCPASLKYNWKREISKFTNRKALVLSEIKETMYRKVKKEVLEYDYIIINYEQLQKYEKILKKIPFDCVVLDESHYMSNSGSIRTRKVKSCFSKVEKKILLSGTAIKNRPIEFYPQLNFLRPDLFPNKEHFGLRYCDPQLNSWGGKYDEDNKEKFKGYLYNGASNLRELNAKIAPFYIRRFKEDVLTDLPEKTINLLDLEMTKEEREEYNKICEDFFGIIDSKNEKLSLSLKRIVKIKQYLSKIKIKQIKEFTDNILKENPKKKVIIFSQFKDSQKRLHNYYKNQGNAILSHFSSKKRDDEVEEFNSNPEKRVMVASTIAGGVGFNITSADTVIFADLMWNYSDHEQAEDRAYRIGQKNAVSVYYLNYSNTIEELLWKMIEQKIDIIGQVLDGKDEKESLEEKEIIKGFFNDFKESLN